VTVRLDIDGSAHTGNYQVRCVSCSDQWTGQGEQIGAANFSPALPIAECVVHVKLGHQGQEVDIRFTERYRQWLISYWERASLRIAGSGADRRRSLAVIAARMKS